MRWVALLAMTVFVSDVMAQFKNVKIDDGSSENHLTNPAVTINRRDGHTVVATAGNMIYLSNDAGKSWEKSKVTPPMSANANVLLSDSKGSFYAIQSSSTGNASSSSMQIMCLQSHDNGKTWGEAVAIAPASGKDQYLPASTIDTKGNIFVTWTQFDKFHDADSTCQSLIFMTSSSNARKWNKSLQLSQDPGNCINDNKTVTGGVPAVGPDGKMFVSWYSQGKLMMDRSFGSGMWLQHDILIGNQTTGWSLKVPGHEQTVNLPEIVIDQSKGTYHGCLYITWADQRNGEADTDVWFMRSNNHGDNWSSPLRLGNATLAKHQYAPRMTIDQTNGYIYVIFFDRNEHDDNQTDVFLAYSADSGANFKSVKISETPFTPIDQSKGVYLANIVAHNGTIIPVWSRMDGEITSVWTTTIRQEELMKPPETPKGKKKK